MKIGFIGLGKMGSRMCERLLENGHQLVVTDIDTAAMDALAKKGAQSVKNISDVVAQLSSPRIVWMMVPQGEPVSTLVSDLGELLTKGDMIVDGGNSHYKESMAHAQRLAPRGIAFVDVGTSGGLEGARNGACLMIGGEPHAVASLDPIFRALAVDGGALHVGPSGAGHYLKMVHNAVEFALCQAYGEGFALLQKSPFAFDLAAVANNWNHGSVVRSWLCELAARAFEKDPRLEKMSDRIDGGTMGEWAILESIATKTPLPQMYLALSARYASRQQNSFAAKIVAALRHEFGGHAVEKK